MKKQSYIHIIINKIKQFVPLKNRIFIGKILGVITGQYIFLHKKLVTYSDDLLYTYHNADFRNEKLFKDSYRLGKSTDQDFLLKNYDIEWRIHVLFWASNLVKNLDGDFADCGVHTGIYARSIMNYIDFPKTKKTYYLLDTFSGLDKEYSTKEELKRNYLMGYDKRGDIYEQVKKTFKKFNVRLIKGPIPKTLSQVKSKTFCFVSIDMNCALPEYEALNFFWNKLTKGGIIILDDYGYANSTNEQKKIHDKFAEEKGIKILSLPTGQGLIIKY